MSRHISFDSTPQKKKQPLPKSSAVDAAKKRESKTLALDNQQMEWRLQQLKLAMEKEKKEREKKSFIWQSGKNGALESHARNILGRTVKSNSSSERGSKNAKVKVLSDEPLDIPKRKSHSKDLLDKFKKPTPPNKPFNTGSPEKVINKECWISIGFDRFSEDIMEIQSDQQGNLPLETLKGLNPVAIGLYYVRYGRKRLLLAVDNVVIQPKTGWGSDVFYPYIANISQNNDTTAPFSSSDLVSNHSDKRRNSAIDASTKRFEEKSPELESQKDNLLNGVFDEKANALAFQQAVNAWRNGNETKPSPGNEEKASSYIEMAVHDVQSEPVKSSEINFTETSTLTFMEKLLLLNHRKTAVPALPDFSANISQKNSSVEESVLSPDELEEKEQYRGIFFPLSSQNSSPLEKSSVIVSEVTNDGLDFDDNSTFCYVQEVSDFDDTIPVQQNLETSSAVKIHQTFDDILLEPLANKSREKAAEISSFSLNDNCNLVENTTHQIAQVHETYPKSESNFAKIASFAHDFATVGINSASVIQAIGNVPFNPDAVYRTSLDEYFSDVEQQQHKLYENLDQDPNCLLMCRQGNLNWFIPDEDFQPNFHNNVKIPGENFVTCKAEVALEDQEDCEALEKLEWELASQTGNITNDGRLSRLIDDWSPDKDDQDLGIKNDPGFGSGLSTPDPEPMTLVGTSQSWQDDTLMLQEFQKMENLMIVNDSSSNDSISSEFF